jgi:outer membrane autotransporter protein
VTEETSRIIIHGTIELQLPRRMANLSPAATVAPALVSSVGNVWTETSDAFAARQVELRDAVVTAVADPPSLENPPGTVWATLSGTWTERDAKGADLGYKQNSFGVMAGADFGSRIGETSTLLFGLQGGYLNSSINIRDGAGSNADLEGFDVGAYATLLHGGSFANLLVNATVLDTDLTIAGGSDSTTATTLGGRADIGHRFDLGGGVFLEPSLSALVADTNLGSFTLLGVNFEESNNDLVWLGGGAKLGYEAPGISASLTGRIWDDVSGNRSISVVPIGPALTVSDSGLFDGVFGEVTGKLSFAFSDSGTLFGQGQLRFDDDATSTAVHGGVNFKW